MRELWLALTIFLTGCAASGPAPEANARPATEQAERQRLERELRASARREKALRQEVAALRQQLEALKSIERGVIEREERQSAKER